MWLGRRMMARVYPVSKLFSFLISLLSSKNSRARAECLEECGILVEKNGVSVCGVRHLSVISGEETGNRGRSSFCVQLKWQIVTRQCEMPP